MCLVGGALESRIAVEASEYSVVAVGLVGVKLLLDQNVAAGLCGKRRDAYASTMLAGG